MVICWSSPNRNPGRRDQGHSHQDPRPRPGPPRGRRAARHLTVPLPDHTSTVRPAAHFSTSRASQADGRLRTGRSTRREADIQTQCPRDIRHSHLPHRNPSFPTAVGARRSSMPLLDKFSSRTADRGRTFTGGTPGDRERLPGRVRETGQGRADRRGGEAADILADPFAAWRTFLHPSQRDLAYQTSYAGPAQVTGGPGTGKTVRNPAPFHMLAMSLSTRSSTERNGSLHSTVR